MGILRRPPIKGKSLVPKAGRVPPKPWSTANRQRLNALKLQQRNSGRKLTARETAELNALQRRLTQALRTGKV
ncbi:MAG: hypothetical protein HOE11_02325 [Candidatus Diapherotrites archaeon]|nr:hypothetical protein [Candidatus Diapherotrites archaeon]MBT4596966.1 hypothetical protein [Candidatus Diapherotrites archaeon]